MCRQRRVVIALLKNDLNRHAEHAGSLHGFFGSHGGLNDDRGRLVFRKIVRQVVVLPRDGGRKELLEGAFD